MKLRHTATSIADASNARGENLDCTVRAIAVSTGVDYDVVHRALKLRGRRDRCGAYEHQWLPTIEDVGFLYADVTHLFSGKTARSIEPELRRRGGKYIVKVSRHTIGFDGNKFIDWAAGSLNRVKTVYSILAVGEVAPKREPIQVGLQDTSRDYTYIVDHVKQNGFIEWRIMIHENGKDRWLNMKDFEYDARRAAEAAARKRGIKFSIEVK